MSVVPQRSVIVPIVFNMYFNDVMVKLKCNDILFADDIKLCRVVDSWEDAESLKSNLDVAQDCCDKNNLSTNSTKCKVLSFQRGAMRVLYNY